MKKKICALALSALTACSVCALAACSSNDGVDGDGLACVGLDINPAIELIVDKENNVVSVRGENEDGQVLLYGETGIEGVKIDAAVNKITDLAVEYGYLDENNRVIDMIVTSDDDGFASEIFAKVNTTVTAVAEDLGIEITVDAEGAYSLVRKLEEFKAQFPTDAAIQDLSIQKYKLAASVSETGDISLDAAVKLDEKELLAKLKDSSAKIESYATDAYNKAKTEAVAAYEQAEELAECAAYTEFYLKKALTHPTTAYYGGIYQMYKTAAKSIDVVCDLAEYSAKVSEYPLDETQVEAVTSALGVERKDIENNDGDVTVSSIEAYADKKFKNSAAAAKLEKVKTALTKALSDIESAVKTKVNELPDEYKTKVAETVENVKKVISSVENLITTAMPDAIKTAINNSTAELKEIIADIDKMLTDGTVALDELRGFSDRLENKAEEYATKIESDLTDAEREELEKAKAEAVEKLTAQKKALDDALNSAANSAKNYLAELKAALKK